MSTEIVGIDNASLCRGTVYQGNAEFGITTFTTAAVTSIAAKMEQLLIPPRSTWISTW
ncbi:hypothetical protein [Dyella sp. Tek66A03]|uniref:hypothetical protein n=1 Tax=Dyella sp. Tek66A03 TaxID=3458298 RepID=UPI00403E8F7C